MTLPSSEIVQIRDDLLTLLRDNVASLNTNLTVTITDTTKQIQKGNPNLGRYTTPSTKYPFIFVEAIGDTEEFQNLGGYGRKDVVLSFLIHVFCKLMTSRTDDDDEKYYLCDNIKELLRNNIKFSSNILWSNPVAGDYSGFETGSTYISGGSIQLDCKLNIQG